MVSPVNAILAMRGLEASGLPASTPKPLTMLSTPSGSRSAISSMSFRIDHGVCSAGLSTTQLPAASRGGQLPHGHQDREVPGDDLADHAERLVEVVGHGVLVDLADRALLGADRTGEVPEVVDGQRRGRRRGSRGPACRCPTSRRRRGPRGCPPSGRRSCSRMPDRSPDRGAAPRVGGAVGGIEGELDVLGGGPGDLAEDLARHRRHVLEVAALHRGDPLAADPVVVAALDGDGAAVGTGGWEQRHCRVSCVLVTRPATGCPEARQRDVASTLHALAPPAPSVES